MQAVRAPWTTASFLLYAGGLTIVVAMLALLGVLSGDYGDASFVGWALLVFAVVETVAFGVKLAGRPLLAGWFALAGALAFVVFVGAILSWFGWLADTKGTFDGFHVGNLFLVLVLVLTALFDLRLFRFPLLVLVAAAGAWFFVTDFVSNGGNWSAVVTLVVGIVLLLVALGLDRVYGFWVHVVAGLTIGGALLWFWHTSDTDWILIGLTALLFVALASALDRSSYAVLAAIGLFLTTTHFVQKWFFADVSSVVSTGPGGGAHPVAAALFYALYGLVLIALAMWVWRRRGPAPAPAA